MARTRLTTVAKIGKLEIKRRVKLAETPAVKKPKTEKPKSLQKKGGPVGVTGNTGYYGYAETGEYLRKLDGPAGRDKFDEMRRSDPQVQSVLKAIYLPIRKANYFIEPTSDKEEDKKFAEFLELNLMRGMTMTWDDTIRHALLMLPFGFSILEKIWELRDNLIMPRKLDPRLPQSVVRWNYDKAKRTMTGPIQQDTDGKEYQLPIEKLLVFTTDKEGDNWEGTSILRPAYKPWYIKTQLEKIDAIKHDRHGVGLPVMEVPANVKRDSEEWSDTEEMLENVQANEQAFAITPEGYVLKILGGGEKAGTDAIKSMRYHDEKIAQAMLAMFIYLGTTDTGSRALGESLTDTFNDSLQAFGDYICEVFNRFLIREWVDYNWNVQEYPQLKVNGIQKVKPEQIATLVKDGALTMDEETENVVRTMINLPEKKEDEEKPEEEHETKEAPEEDVEEEELHDHAHGLKLADRNLTDEEQLVDLTGIEIQLDAAEQDLTTELLSIRDRQTEKIIMQIIGGRKVHQITVPEKKEMFDLLMRTFKQQVKQGKKEVVEEITNQLDERTLADPIIDYAELYKLIEEDLELAVEGASDRLKAMIYAMAIDLKKKGVKGEFLKAEIYNRLEDRLTDSAWKDLAAGAVNMGWGTGRDVAAEKYRDDIDYSYYSAILDGNACSECRPKDQTRHEYGDPEYQTPNPDCKGRHRCRCMTIFVMKAESAPEALV